jgi:predicted  nucleic acid-binding Zn-ribbon protein
MPPARAKTLNDIGIPDTTKVADPGEPSLLDQLREERKRFEQYTQEQHARLGRLRETIKEERAAADAELDKKRKDLAAAQDENIKKDLEEARKQLAARQHVEATLVAERDSARTELQGARQKGAQLSAEWDSARNEIQTLKQQLAKGQGASEEAAKLKQQLGALQAESARQESELAAERRRLADDHRQLGEELKRLQQREAGLRQQLEEARAASFDAIAQERKALEDRSRELRILETEVKEKQQIAHERFERERNDLAEERVRIARMAEAWRLAQEKVHGAGKVPAVAPSTTPPPVKATSSGVSPPSKPMVVATPAGSVAPPKGAPSVPSAPSIYMPTMTVVCSGCTLPLQVKETTAGKQVKCPRCSKILTVPEAAKK